MNIHILQPRPHVLVPQIKLLLYGSAGTGKTTLAGTSASLGKCIFINVEGGMLSVPENPNIIVLDLKGNDGNTLAKLNYIIDQLSTPTEEWAKDAVTVVLDSGTELLTVVLEEVIQEAVTNNPKRKDEFEIWQEDYGKATIALKHLLRRLKSLEMNVIVTALAREVTESVKGKDPEVVAVQPEFTPKLLSSVMGYFDHVWYTYLSNKGVYSLLTSPVGTFRVKTRGHAFADALGSRIENPTIPNIMDILLKSSVSK